MRISNYNPKTVFEMKELEFKSRFGSPFERFRFEDEDINRRLAYMMVISSKNGDLKSSSEDNSIFRKKKLFNMEGHYIKLRVYPKVQEIIVDYPDDRGIPKIRKVRPDNPSMAPKPEVQLFEYVVVNQKNGLIRFESSNLNKAVFDSDNHGALLSAVSRIAQSKVFLSKRNDANSKTSLDRGGDPVWENEIREVSASKDQKLELKDFEYDHLCPKSGPITTWTVAKHILEVVRNTERNSETWTQLCKMRLCNWNTVSETAATAFDVCSYKMPEGDKEATLEKVIQLIDDTTPFRASRTKKDEFGMMMYPGFTSKCSEPEISKAFFKNGYANRNFYIDLSKRLQDWQTGSQNSFAQYSERKCRQYESVIENMAEVDGFIEYLEKLDAKYAASLARAIADKKRMDGQINITPALINAPQQLRI